MNKEAMKVNQCPQCTSYFKHKDDIENNREFYELVDKECVQTFSLSDDFPELFKKLREMDVVDDYGELTDKGYSIFTCTDGHYLSFRWIWP